MDLRCVRLTLLQDDLGLGVLELTELAIQVVSEVKNRICEVESGDLQNGSRVMKDVSRAL